MRAGSRCHWAPPPGSWTSQSHQRQVASTSTKVPRFAGVTSWEQYRELVFDAIVLSNGWDDATAALQLLSHLEGDALNVAKSRQATQVGALTTHYGSPGRLADHRRQFEWTTQTAGEDPSIFAIALETLAVKAFGDMGQTARLRIIRDRFIAGHDSCELRRHLECVAGILWIIAGCGRVMPIWTLGDSVSRDRTGHCGGIVERTVERMTGLWLQLRPHSQCQISWRLCSDDYFPVQWCLPRLPNQFGAVVTVITDGGSDSAAGPAGTDWTL